MQDVDLAAGSARRYSLITVEHFQHPRHVGRLADANGVGRVDDVSTDTTITLYVKVGGGRVVQASFRALGCSACVAASSMATDLLTGAALEAARAITPARLDEALGGLPDDKRYCVELAALAVQRALDATVTG